MYNDITAAILSGGKSTRMGENKSLMKIGDRTVIERVKDLLDSLFSKVILITNEPEEYGFLKLQTFRDIYPGRGPLSGIHSALKNSGTDKCFIIASDIPLMKREMIEYLVNYRTGKMITIARAGGFIQQLCGLYHKSCIPEAEKILLRKDLNEERFPEQKKRRCSVLELADSLGAEVIDASGLPFSTDDMYYNMNRREEFEYVKSKLTGDAGVS
ncbi:MAG: molybdenum cofactor guanylyltransferase [Ignavibacteria bacterium]|jgi:molybdopterin-guanine dinucleotide biosynthesis protein A|nr:molybdenum cofactor guanylyltransferase [Ignavibacteria bacterium]MCU7497687.1 molybdenum cofactor guanylyltransferase [Ignavibacteria bacterium]MCU7511008.1 molybdenum cofactor guanylyltransferase [Ignavibacteria bacterium]MCU7518862.1 molybdenum cofactor guanylyltransferase [Ignavibacteria bacterium]MCU7523170.1 molybdenum cofactor guanylyltransferase [Ignavibacteria bacterium]